MWQLFDLEMINLEESDRSHTALGFDKPLKDHAMSASGQTATWLRDRTLSACGPISGEAYRSEECRLRDSPAITAESRNQRKSAPDGLVQKS